MIGEKRDAYDVDSLVGYKAMLLSLTGDLYGSFQSDTMYRVGLTKAQCHADPLLRQVRQAAKNTSFSQSLTFNIPWGRGTRYEEHLSPDPEGNCLCGFNVYKDKEQAIKHIRIDDDQEYESYLLDKPLLSLGGHCIPVVAQVELFGRVVEYEDGYRGEWQRVLKILLPKNEFLGPQDVRRMLQVECEEFIPVKQWSSWTTYERTANYEWYYPDPSRQGDNWSITKEVRTAKNGRQYLYMSHPVKFDKNDPRAQTTVRAITVFYNEDTGVYDVMVSMQSQVAKGPNMSYLTYPCRPEYYVKKDGVPWVFKKHRGKLVKMKGRRYQHVNYAISTARLYLVEERYAKFKELF